MSRIAIARLSSGSASDVFALMAVDLRQIVQGGGDVAMDGTVFLLERLQLPLRQRQRFRIFAGAAEFVDSGAERCSLTLLRRRRCAEARGRKQRERSKQDQSIDGNSCCGFYHWPPLRGCGLGRAEGRRRSNAHRHRFPDYSLARASLARRTSILRSSPPLVTRSGKSSRSVAAARLHVHAVGVAAGAGPVGALGPQQPRGVEVHRLAVILVHVLHGALLGFQEPRGIADIGQELHGLRSMIRPKPATRWAPEGTIRKNEKSLKSTKTSADGWAPR